MAPALFGPGGPGKPGRPGSPRSPGGPAGPGGPGSPGGPRDPVFPGRPGSPFGPWMKVGSDCTRPVSRAAVSAVAVLLGDLVPYGSHTILHVPSIS